MFDHAHLDVSFLEQFVSHAAAVVKQGPLATGPRFMVIISLRRERLLRGHFPQQRLALFGRIKLIVVQFVSSTAPVKIHVKPGRKSTAWGRIGWMSLDFEAG